MKSLFRKRPRILYKVFGNSKTPHSKKWYFQQKFWREKNGKIEKLSTKILKNVHTDPPLISNKTYCQKAIIDVATWPSHILYILKAIETLKRTIILQIESFHLKETETPYDIVF